MHFGTTRTTNDNGLGASEADKRHVSWTTRLILDVMLTCLLSLTTKSVPLTRRINCGHASSSV